VEDGQQLALPVRPRLIQRPAELPGQQDYGFGVKPVRAKPRSGAISRFRPKKWTSTNASTRASSSLGYACFTSSADSAALLAGLSGGTDPAAVLHSVARAVLEGDGLGYTLRKAEQYAALAGETLDSLTGLSTADRQIFKNLLGYVIERSQ